MSDETVQTSPTGTGAERGERWWRGGYMLLFVIAFSLAQSLHTLLAIVQWLALMIFGKPNQHLTDFGAGLAEWTRQTSRFLTCVADERPWPFAPWPKRRD
ncbi:MAG: DUF4389 domain-containing protein [Pseudomonadota bacterium]